MGRNGFKVFVVFKCEDLCFCIFTKTDSSKLHRIRINLRLKGKLTEGFLYT